MSTSPKSPPYADLTKSGSRLRAAMAIQSIEENPLDVEQIAMFEMFERENWPHEKRRAHLASRILRKVD